MVAMKCTPACCVSGRV